MLLSAKSKKKMNFVLDDFFERVREIFSQLVADLPRGIRKKNCFANQGHESLKLFLTGVALSYSNSNMIFEVSWTPSEHNNNIIFFNFL